MKSSSMTAAKTDANEDSAIHLIRTAACPSLSDKSKLTFQIGCKEKSDVWFRITHNSGSGSFSDSWVSLREILDLFGRSPRGEAITAWMLAPLFRGRSQNSPFFLFAVLKHEGLVQSSKDVRRCYEAVDSKDFLAKVQAWMDGKGESQTKATGAKRKSPAADKEAKPKKQRANSRM